MAQANFTPIQLYSSGTALAAPVAGNLANGELALNFNDGKLYYKNSSSVVTLLASAAGALGNVVGPASATDGNLAAFDGVTGKLIKQAAAVTVAQGGTGQTTQQAAINALVGTQTANRVLRSDGTNSTLAQVALATDVSGTLPVANGGTNLTSYTANGVLYASGTGTLANGNVLTFSSGNLGLGVASAFYKFDVQAVNNFVTPYIASFNNTSTSTTEANIIRILQGASGSATGILGTGGSAYSDTAFANNFAIGTLGSNSFVFITALAERGRFDTTGNLQVRSGAVMPYAPAPATVSTTATLANADIQAQIINTTGTSYTVTMPLGTTLETLATWSTTNIGYDFTVINTASGTITIAANTGVTTLGGLTLATGTSAQFRIRRTSANTFVLYRLS